MAKYLKLYRNHKEYARSSTKPFISHCIGEIHLHFDSYYYQHLDDGNPREGAYDLDGGYYCM